MKETGVVGTWRLPTGVHGYVIAGVAGVAVGSTLALLTRNVRRWMALLLFGVIFVPILGFSAIVLVKQLKPAALEGAPLLPLLAGSVVYGAVFPLVLLLRGR